MLSFLVQCDCMCGVLAVDWRSTAFSSLSQVMLASQHILRLLDGKALAHLSCMRDATSLMYARLLCRGLRGKQLGKQPPLHPVARGWCLLHLE